MSVIKNQNGFTYLLALTILMIMGVMLGLVGQSWKTIKQLDLEEELIYRGDLIADVINQKLLCVQAPAATAANYSNFLWTVNSPNGTILDDLVIGKDQRCFNGSTKRFRLRASAIIDPMTGKQFRIVTHTGDVTRFSGVASTSEEEPFKKNFSTMYNSKALDDKKQYAEWAFTAELRQALPQK